MMVAYVSSTHTVYMMRGDTSGYSLKSCSSAYCTHTHAHTHTHTHTRHTVGKPGELIPLQPLLTAVRCVYAARNGDKVAPHRAPPPPHPEPRKQANSPSELRSDGALCLKAGVLISEEKKEEGLRGNSWRSGDSGIGIYLHLPPPSLPLSPPSSSAPGPHRRPSRQITAPNLPCETADGADDRTPALFLSVLTTDPVSASPPLSSLLLSLRYLGFVFELEL